MMLKNEDFENFKELTGRHHFRHCNCRWHEGYYCNVGDPKFVYVCLTQDGKVKHIQPLNTQHGASTNPGDAAAVESKVEQERIKKILGKLRFDDKQNAYLDDRNQPLIAWDESAKSWRYNHRNMTRCIGASGTINSGEADTQVFDLDTDILKDQKLEAGDVEFIVGMTDGLVLSKDDPSQEDSALKTAIEKFYSHNKTETY